jgi:septum formation protein
MPRLILASASPRRRELLARLGLPFRVVKVRCSESASAALPPADVARLLAWRKAEHARRTTRRGIIITGDTVVALGQRRFGKPRSRAAARHMVRQLSGRTHEVITGLAVLDARTGVGVLGSAVSRVTFRRLSPAAIRAYVATGESMDKAGAYGIQGGGRALVRQISGDYTNIVGLPVGLLRELLRRLGVRTRRSTI